MAFEIVAHTADVRLRLTADSFEDLLKDGVAGLMKIMDGKGLGEEIERRIALSASDRTNLLVDFLNEVLTSAQIYREKYDSIVFERLDENGVTANISGFKVDRFIADVKAVTYHMAEVKEEDGKWSVSLVLDV